MKSLVKEFFPPIIWRVLRTHLNQKTQSITYSGVYSSFKQVLESFSNVTNFNSEESTELSLQEARAKFALMESGAIPSLNWENTRLNLFPTLLSACELKNPISIIDIGGGLGTSYVDLKFSCPQIDVDYTVYELPETVKQAGEFSSKYPEISFTPELPRNKRVDFALFGSSLQYFESYAEVINDVCQMEPKFVLLSDHPMGDFDTFVCAQVNMKDRVIPRYVFSIKEVVSLFEKSGYELISKSVNYYPFHDFSNYDEKHSNAQHYNLAFKKRGSPEESVGKK